MSRERSLTILRLLLPLAVLGILILIGAERPHDGSATQPRENRQGSKRDSDAIGHGKYLVHHVAMCSICHTPKTRDGKLIETKLLQGSPIPVKNPYPSQPWALKAPKLAGLPGGWNEKSLAQFLQSGKSPHGHRVRPPMPPFRMNPKDAHAVAAYLKSLDAD